MIDAIVNAIQLDEFFIALAGHLATEASAKVAFSTAKAVAFAAVGAMFSPAAVSPKRSRKLANAASKLPKKKHRPKRRVKRQSGKRRPTTGDQ